MNHTKLILGGIAGWLLFRYLFGRTGGTLAKSIPAPDALTTQVVRMPGEVQADQTQDTQIATLPGDSTKTTADKPSGACELC